MMDQPVETKLRSQWPQLVVGWSQCSMEQLEMIKIRITAVASTPILEVDVVGMMAFSLIGTIVHFFGPLQRVQQPKLGLAKFTQPVTLRKLTADPSNLTAIPFALLKTRHIFFF